ncbi:hypothetical protein Scep_028615 [Stephania cephalantha]|uniref:Serine-threonine/tyrosine-protein kinase catalytic domain-containing protein n=1 Tax=Stephania cephalantha TaxID=152367 RepID=A0AAP0HIA8_9MAGN
MIIACNYHVKLLKDFLAICPPIEYAIRGLFSTKSDVYRFGVLLLEILSGKKNAVLDISNSCTLLGYVSSFIVIYVSFI